MSKQIQELQPITPVVEESISKNQIKNEKKEPFKNQDVVGMLTIPKINLNQEVKEGIDQKTLLNYIGHFPSTSMQNGNVGLAAHNRGYKNNFFANIYKLKAGDEIIYQSKYGIKNYIVKVSKEISDEDWSYLQKTKDNRITLITCIKNKPNKRLCVQATENDGSANTVSIQKQDEYIGRNAIDEPKQENKKRRENIEKFKKEIFNCGIVDDNRIIDFSKLYIGNRNK